MALAVTIQRALHRTPLDQYSSLALTPLGNPPPPSFSGLRATFMGVSTILLDDGVTAIMTDGFFTRPSLWDVALPGATIAPNRTAVEDALRRAHVNQLAAVIPVHSHYDHALDAPLVAQLTGAVILGSESSANIARGSGLPESRIIVPKHSGDTFEFGDFSVRLILSRHSSKPFWEGVIEAPLTPPAPAGDFRMGECFSVLVHHRRLDRSILIQASTNYIEGALKGQQADVVFLGTPGLSTWRESASTLAVFRDKYWDEVVATVGARRVIPVHWDDFFAPQPLVSTPAFVEDLGRPWLFCLGGGRGRG